MRANVHIKVSGMQRKFFVLVSVGCVMLLSVAAVLAQVPQPRRPASSLTTEFTYQGQLKSSGAPVNGSCDIEFRLYDVPSGDSTQYMERRYESYFTFAI